MAWILVHRRTGKAVKVRDEVKTSFGYIVKILDFTDPIGSSNADMSCPLIEVEFDHGRHKLSADSLDMVWLGPDCSFF